jgi:hypothetical protein
MCPVSVRNVIARQPLLLRGLDLLHRRMEVARDDRHHLLQPRVLGFGVPRDHDLGRIGFREEPLRHRRLPHRASTAASTRRNSAAGSCAISSARQAT